MNKIYRTLWNAATQSWVVVSELAKSDGKSASAKTGLINTNNISLISAAVSLVLLSSQTVAADVVGNKHTLSNNNDGNYCFFDKTSQSVICGDEATKTVDKTTNGNTAKSVIIGSRSNNEGESNVAIGINAQTKNTASIAIGNEAKALDNQAIAIGQGASGNSDWDISIGRQAGANQVEVAKEGRNIAIGDGALRGGSKLNNNTALGTSAGERLSGTHNVMMGTYANTHEAVQSALNTGATIADIKAKENSDNKYYIEASNTMALGHRALATQTAAVAIGQQAKALGNQSISTGNGSKAQGDFSIANGSNAYATNSYSIAIGSTGNANDTARTFASGNSSIAMGNAAHATKANTIALGRNANSAGDNTISIGYNAGVNKTENEAQGDPQNKVVAATDAIFIGNKAGYKSNNNRLQVSIGNESGSGIVGTENITFGNSAGKNTKGNTNVAISSRAGQNVEGHDNFAALLEAGQNIKGVNNIAIGKHAGRGTDANQKLAINNTIALGKSALASQNDGIAIGQDSKTQATNAIAIGRSTTISDKGLGSVAIGAYSSANGVNSAAIGQKAEASGQNSFAGGQDSHATGKSSIAIGDGARGSSDSSIAVGTYSKASAGGTTALGYKTQALGYRSSALGSEASATAISTSSVAVGDKSQVNAVKGVAIGYNAQAIGGETANIAIGDSAKADASGAIVLGTKAEASSLTDADGKKYGAYSAIVIGTEAKAIAQQTQNGKYENPKDAIAIGTKAEAHYASAIALGAGAKSDTKAQAVSIGYNSNAKGYQAIAFGSEAKTTENAGSSIALGTKAHTRAAFSLAFGSEAETGFDGGSLTDGAAAIALGQKAKAKKQSSIALGQDAIADHKDAVALGSGSQTADAIATTQATVSGFTYSGFAGTVPTSTVSVGKAGAERTITNVAAGRVEATSTDAINGSQLYLTQQLLGNVGNTVTSILGGNAQIAKNGNTAGNITMSDIGGTGKTTIHDAIQSVNNVAKAAKTQVVQGDNIVVTENAGTDGNTVYTVATAKDVHFDKTTVGSVVIDKETNDITGLANKELTSADFGTKGRAATEEQLSKAMNQVTGILGGDAKFENGTVTMTNIGDTGATNIHDAIKAVNATAKASKTTVVEGENITVTAETATDGSRTYTVATKKDVKFDSAVAGGTKIDSNGLTFVNDDGSKVENSPSISKTGIDAGNQKVTNVQKGEVAKDSKDAVNGSQLFAQGKGVENIMGGNTTYDPTTGTYTNSDIGGTGKNTIDDAIKASRNEVEAGKNMTVTPTLGANGQTIYEVATKDNVEFKEIKVGPSVTINESGLQAGNIKVDATSNKISGLAKGDVSATSTDAVNGSQLHELSQKINQQGNNYNALDKRINNVDRKLRAGIAGANAAAGLPQAYIPGKSMVAAAVGTYKGENAIAVGMSRISDNGKVIIKLTGNTNSRGDFGGSIGAGYQW
ncbi:YadA-like family protein [Pasteurella canis]|uniref:YadA-like family protein n=1 Tax=Pasteurella canis TaxID=753 RepID=UPI001E5CF101|nr:YadA-like family protein [Pasteurella canis]UEA16420.1 YadA-like family protein [Pasteurella canis]